MPLRQFITRVTVFVVLAGALLFGCTTKNREAGYLYLRLGGDPSTLDPALVTDITGGLITAKIYSGLVKLGDNLDVKPDIAESFVVSKDGLVYRFKIKRGVKFSNGREVRAGDFKYSFERVLNPKTRSSNTWVLDVIEGIKAIDDYTLEIKLKKPFLPFLSLLTMTPAYAVPKEEVEKWGPDFSAHPCGAGPFTLAEWLPGRHLKLEKRNDYFDAPAKVAGIIYRMIPEDMTAVMEFELGNLDVISIPSSEYSRYRDSSEWGGLVNSIEGINTYYVGFNCERPPFNDPALRRAFNLAIDRERILKTLYEGRGRSASGPVPDALRKWPAPPGYPYDPARAREIIKGINNVREVNLYITADQQVVDMAEVIQAYLSEAGLRVKIRQLEWSAFKEAVNKGEPDMFWLSWWADYADPENFLFPLFHSSNHGPAGNRSRYTNREVDSLIEKGRNSPSAADAARYYEKAEWIVVRDAPWVFFWHRNDYTIRQASIKNFRLYPVYSMDKGLGVSF